MLSRLKPFWQLLRPYRSKVVASIILASIAGAATGGGLAKGAEYLFSEVLGGEADLTTLQMFLIASLFPALFLLIGVCTFLSAYLLNAAGLGALRDLRQRLFTHLQSLPLAYFQSKSSGDLISRLTADTHMLQLTLNLFARNALTQPAAVLGALAFLTYSAFKHEGLIQIYLCILGLPVVIFPVRHINRRLEGKARSQQQELGQLTSELSQNLSAAREVRAFNLQEREIKRFSQRVGDLFRVQMKVVKYSSSLGPVVELFSSIGLSIAFIIGYRNDISTGVFTAIFFALYITYASVKKLGTFSGELRKGSAALSRIDEVLDEPARIQNPASPVTKERVQGHVAFNSVSFSYGDTPALKDVSVNLPQGCVCALVGPSGAGKSTFANLVPRFYDAQEGSVTIDGTDVRDFDLQNLRSHIAIVSQDPVLFDDTILENIRLGRQEASDEDVYRAAKYAFADEFVSAFKDGYQTMVGERGTRLSGGQKQRIAIARAFLRDAPILILDEATSALDSESEAKVQQALEKLMQGKTVIIIAHRFSTIKHAQQILVFHSGRLIDSGSHDSLMQDCNLYQALYQQQATLASSP